MKEFMFIYKSGNPNWSAATAEQKSATMAKWGAWLGALGQKGQLVTGGSPLEFGGKRLKKDGVLTDIAASEIKELVSGYSIVKAENYEQAAAIARDCPIFAYEGAAVEIRVVAAM
ncbi:MAG TPA: YciI family protein [Polyangiaceae bacterium]|nr:YciI family protein [Polyangiaceae bacterium]